MDFCDPLLINTLALHCPILNLQQQLRRRPLQRHHPRNLPRLGRKSHLLRSRAWPIPNRPPRLQYGRLRHPTSHPLCLRSHPQAHHRRQRYLRTIPQLRHPRDHLATGIPFTGADHRARHGGHPGGNANQPRALVLLRRRGWEGAIRQVLVTNRAAVCPVRAEQLLLRGRRDLEATVRRERRLDDTQPK